MAAIADTPSRMVISAVSVGLGVGLYGISFGVLAVAAGLSRAQACVMSMLGFTRSSQVPFVRVFPGRLPGVAGAAAAPGGGAGGRRHRGRARGGAGAARAGRPAGDRGARRPRPGRAGGTGRALVSWAWLLALCAVSYALKALGPV